jgi:branched-chain amino acid transport system substrate-binding protein
MLDEPRLSDWVSRYVKRWNSPPADYSITAYDAALVILAAIGAAAKSGKPVNRDTVRDAIQAGKVDTLQGPIAFDANGDIASRVVSVFQVQQDTAHPVNDVIHQFKYIGTALADNT